MSWFVVFASTVLPIALLFILLVMDWLQRGTETTPSLLRIRDRDGTPNENDTRGSIMVDQAVAKGRKYLVSAGMLALAITAGQDLNALASGPQIPTSLKTDVSGPSGQEWNVLTVELAPGVVDARHASPGSELVYVMEGEGVLEVNGRTPVTLNPGVVATFQAKQPHVFKNTSQSRTLKVLVVLLLEKGHQRPLYANGVASSHSSVRKQVANVSPRQQKADAGNGSTSPGLVF